MDKVAEEFEDDQEWAHRAEYWGLKSLENPYNHRSNKRRDRRPLIICGHGARLNIDRGTLLVRNGFTHYPQKQEEFRYFRGDPHLPSRIIIIDASGSISFHVLAWLNEQEIPLIQINWQGEIICVANSNYAATPKLVQAQYKSLEDGSAQRQFQNLIAKKFENSISTVKLLPNSLDKLAAIEFFKSGIIELSGKKTISNGKLLGIEGRAAALYFAAWRGIPIKWKLSRKTLIPADWNSIGGRRSTLGKSNRYARHPLNAMLNYAYAVLHNQIKMQIIAEGLDPTIGLSHSTEKYRDALVLDRMEPLRPIVDAAILKRILNNELHGGDFTLTNEGICRLNPQLARKVVTVTISALGMT